MCESSLGRQAQWKTSWLWLIMRRRLQRSNLLSSLFFSVGKNSTKLSFNTLVRSVPSHTLLSYLTMNTHSPILLSFQLRFVIRFYQLLIEANQSLFWVDTLALCQKFTITVCLWSHRGQNHGNKSLRTQTCLCFEMNWQDLMLFYCFLRKVLTVFMTGR